jgi:hypothetical protein
MWFAWWVATLCGSVVDRSATMTFLPEFAAHWLDGRAPAAPDARNERHDDETASQEAALEALAERVNAARSIV